MKTMILMLVLTVFSKIAYSECEVEKKKVDRWHSILKNKVTEFARNKHRDAKEEFLDCLRQPIAAEQSKSSTINPAKTRTTSKPVYKRPSNKSLSHLTVTAYTNFKGKKKLAWERYFTESNECLSNKGDMKIFVACAKVRKQNLKAFNARWNNQTQALMPLLDSSNN